MGVVVGVDVSVACTAVQLTSVAVKYPQTAIRTGTHPWSKRLPG